MPIIQLVSSFLCSLSQMLFNSVPLFYVHYSECYSLRFFYSMLVIPDVIQLGSSFLCSLSQMLFSSFPLFYVYYPECYSGSVYLFYAHYPRCYSTLFLFSMFITANVIRSLFHCFIGQFFNCSSKLGVKECNGMHSECSARRVPTLRK